MYGIILILTSKLPHLCKKHFKPMNNQNIQTRYDQQVRDDRRAAALQRRLDRETTGLADVDLVNRLYQN